MIKVIAFDYGGVIEISEVDLIEEITSYLKIERKDWSQVYFSLNHLCNTGVNTWDEVIVLTSQKLNANNEQIHHINTLIEKNRSNKKINTELIDIIKNLKKHNYKIGLLSNYSSELRQRIDDQNLTNLFDQIVISGEVGFQKPQPEIFLSLCQNMQISPTELIFIDDTKKSLKGAQDIGYTPILYKNNQQLLNDLSSLLPTFDIIKTHEPN